MRYDPFIDATYFLQHAVFEHANAVEFIRGQCNLSLRLAFKMSNGYASTNAIKPYWPFALNAGFDAHNGAFKAALKHPLNKIHWVHL